MSATRTARAVLETLLRHGVRDVVVAPGSRSAPLAYAAWEAAEGGLVRLHTRIDERSAGFLAVGLGRTGAPAAVVCTSGSAVANLHPAVLEAAHAGLPLWVLTADRPARMRGTGANQTTDQVGVFGRLVATVDVDGPAALDGPASEHGPVHLNVPLDEPLVPDGPWDPLPDPPTAPAGRGAHGPQEEHVEHVPDEAAACGTVPALAQGPPTVVVAGDDAGPPARVLAEAAGWPLLAEPTSGSRTGDHAIRGYRLLLDGPLGQAVRRVVVCGHPTLSRPVSRLLARGDVEVWSTPGRGAWPERPFAVDHRLPSARVEVAGEHDPAWLEAWRAADAELGVRLDALLGAEPGITPYEVAGAVSRAVPPGGLLVVGASNPVRDLDLMVAPYAVGDRRKVIANRGLSGIDGTVSTAIGAALGRPHGTRNLALLGDLTFLHDAGGLVLGPDEPRPDLTLVVVNDDGGSIFATLEPGEPERSASFERLFGTPHGVDLAALCAATRTPYLRADSLPELEALLASPTGGVEVVEVRVDRAGRRDLDARIRALAQSA